MGAKGTILKLVAGGVAIGAIAVLVIPPISAATMDYPPLNIGENSIVYGSDGSELGVIQASGRGNATLKSEQIPPLIKQAFLAAEDRSFLEHDGISYGALLRAAYLSIDKGSLGAGGGGSTISQQYVKNAYLTRDQTIERYGKGIALAWKVESDYSKDEIETMYINSNYYGKGAVGVEDAAQIWFGHSATIIKDARNPEHVAKAAFLAALVQRPSFFDETVDGKPGEIPHVELRKRQLYTIDGFRQIKGIAASDMVPAESIEPAKKFPMNIDALIKAKGNKGGGTSTNLDPALLNYIKDWLAATEAEAMRQADSSISDEVATKQGREHAKLLLAQGGLKFYTTIEPKLQNNLVQSIGRLPKRGLAAGGIIMNAETGAVAAMYGGTDGNNHALYAERQPGSVMKTVVLANMVKEGISVKSELPAPACIKMDKQSKEQCNDDNNPGGGTACKLSIEKAVALSNNPVFLESISGKMAPSCNEATNPDKLVAVSDDYPVSPKSATDLAHKMGADDSTVPVKTSPAKLDPVPSFTLGASSLTPLKVASIGATLVDGVHNKPYIIQKIMLGAGKGTEVAYEQKDQSARVLSQEQAGIVNQVLTRVYTEGTARGAQVPGHPLAGKTGTTPFDAWMLAWSPIDPNKKVPSLVCSVWAGYPDNRKTSEKGGDLWGADVAKVCQGFYTEAFKGAPKVDFPAANLDSGKKVGLNK